MNEPAVPVPPTVRSRSVTDPISTSPQEAWAGRHRGRLGRLFGIVGPPADPQRLGRGRAWPYQLAADALRLCRLVDRARLWHGADPRRSGDARAVHPACRAVYRRGRDLPDFVRHLDRLHRLEPCLAEWWQVQRRRQSGPALARPLFLERARQHGFLRADGAGGIRHRLWPGAAAQRRDRGQEILARGVPDPLHALAGRRQLDGRQVDDGIPLRPGGAADAHASAGSSRPSSSRHGSPASPSRRWMPGFRSPSS